MKMRGLPCTVTGCITPGENAMTWPNVSPVPMPSESAYDAPSECPPIAIRLRSTAQRA